MPIGLDLLIGTVTSLLSDVAMSGFRRVVRAGFPAPFYLHKRELARKLSEMPFIYRDLTSDVLSDFVEVEIGTLDPQTAQQMPRPVVEQDLSLRMQHRRKALLLGSAGLGKTTYFRYTLLNMLRKKWPPFLFPNERVVPFYVPLKAVANAGPSPIINYILENNSYLSSPWGRGTLRRLAAKGRVMLFLDGYDEIYMDVGRSKGHNYVREELATLLGRRPPSLPGCSAEFRDIYNGMSGSRVWLSSRREFYVDHPIDLSGVLGDAIDCLGLALEGLGNSRYQLVEKIFAKYRLRSSVYNDVLSEELFLTQIDRSAHPDVAELSNNPLFLTVMCYVYVHKMPSYGVEDEWALNASELVEECLQLLLRDIDEMKARGLPAAQRAALVKRRNDFHDEKRRFLPFFAWRTLEERCGVFELSYVNAQAKEFFLAEQHIDSDRVMRNLAGDYSRKDTLAHQLANQGVFVVVERSNARTTYDFAHRRFREVLAARHVDSNWSVQQIGNVLDRDDLAEFVVVLMRLSSSRNEIFQNMLDQVMRAPEREALGRLVSRCAVLEIRDFRSRELLEQFLLKCLEASVSPGVSNDVLRMIRPSASTIVRISEFFAEGLSAHNRNRITLGGELLRIQDVTLLRQLLEEHFVMAVADVACIADLVALAYRAKKTELILTNMPLLASTDQSLAIIASVLAGRYSRLTIEAKFAENLLRRLGQRKLALVMSFVYAHSSSAFALIEPQLTFSSGNAICQLIRFARSRSPAWNEMQNWITTQSATVYTAFGGVVLNASVVSSKTVPTAVIDDSRYYAAIEPTIVSDVIQALAAADAQVIHDELISAPTFTP